MDESLDSWFKREIVVHEEDLMRYIRRCWRRDPAEVYDLRQDTYVRIYQAAMRSRPVHARSFLFTTARNLMADRIRHNRVITIDTAGDLGALNVLVDDLSPERRNIAWQELRILARALDTLPPKCRQAIWLRKVEDLSQEQIARRLNVTQKTVEWHLAKGLRRLARIVLGDSLAPDAKERQPETRSETPHGKQ